MHWAIIWIGIGGLGFRGLALYKLFEMRPVFEATSSWPPPYLAGLTLAVRTSITVTTRATGCSSVYPDRTRVRSLRSPPCTQLAARVRRLQPHVPSPQPCASR